jgi:alkanesulfonate monooxygenase SsuD/methylene tetrahydromethanopterin reductase-like flavin-dependent oxidoreductase (luciferase family)
MMFSLGGTTGQPWANIVEAIKTADELGFAAYYPSYHLIQNNVTPGMVNMHESLTVMAAMAAMTKNVRLGPCVTPVMMHHPVVLAKLSNTVDHISNGRVIIGLGLGGFETEYNAYGIPLPGFRERVNRLSEMIQIMKMLFTQERSDFDGKYYKLTDAPFDPKSIRKPHPPFLLAGKSPSMAKLAAQHAEELNFMGGYEQAAEKRREVDDLCRAIGRDPSTLRISRQIQVLFTEDKAEVDRFVDYQKVFRSLHSEGQIRDEEQLRRTILSSSMVGGTAEVKEQIARWRDVGVTHLNFNWPRFLDPEPRRKMLVRFMEQVAPDFM